MIAPHAIRTAAVLAAIWVAHSACDWEDLDAIVPLQGAGDDQAYDAEVVADGTETADVPEGEPADARVGADSDALSQDATSGGDGADSANALDALAGDASESSAACATASASGVKQWTFDTSTEGWSLLDGAGVTVTWANNVGSPTAAGALEVDGLPVTDDAASSQSHVGFDESPAVDLSGRTLAAWLWLDSGTSPSLKLFVQTGRIYTWADGGSVVLPLRTWTCVSLNVSAPAYASQNGVYDPTNVIRVGFEFDGSASYRVYVDSVMY
jgi:hypothetical protein